jgi:hypothetical protein
MSSNCAAPTSAHTGPTTNLAGKPHLPLRRQLESEKRLRPRTPFVIIQDSGSVAVFKMGRGRVGGGAIVEGLAAANGNRTTKNCNGAQSVNIRWSLKYASDHQGPQFTGVEIKAKLSSGNARQIVRGALFFAMHNEVY